MKKAIKLPLLLLLALSALIAVCVYFSSFGKTADAYTYIETTDPYSYYFEDYDVTYDVAANRKISVTEKITIHFTGRLSTGFMKDIPVNGGEQVQNIKVFEILNGVQTSVVYDVYSEYADFLTIDIGDLSNKTDKVFTYLINYDYCLTKAQEGKDTLKLNVIGLGRNCVIENASVTLTLPDSYKSARCLVGTLESDSEKEFLSENQNKTISLKNLYLTNNEGVTFEVDFESGVLSTYTDFTPYVFVIIGAVLLAAAILLRLFVFNKVYLTPVVNYEAPNKMDPLLMGKLIDNKVDNEDVTSLIYYWADKGFIKINLDDKNDPSIIRVMQTLPDSYPSYQKIMYNELFARGDVVKPSQLKYTFYRTVDKVTGTVNKQNKDLYNRNSLILAIIFAVAGGLLLGLAPLILTFTQISSRYLVLTPLIIIIPLFAIAVLAQSIKYNRLKTSKSKIIALSAFIVLLAVVFGFVYALLVPSYVISNPSKVVLYIVGCLVSISSVLMLTRTKEYNEKLNDIVGFKNFILLAEKDQLEMMLEDDPQFYYHVLPYAQVLGVTNKWEEKFAKLTVQPPRWLTGNVVTTYIEFRVINSMISGSMNNISRGMVSRPSSSGSSGGGRGGFHGGHVGGGHGGGGFRGR